MQLRRIALEGFRIAIFARPLNAQPQGFGTRSVGAVDGRQHLARALCLLLLRQQAWREIDATLCADLRNRMRSAPVTLTLCSEHAAHRYQSTAQSPMQQLWQRAHRLFQPLTIHTALQAL